MKWGGSSAYQVEWVYSTDFPRRPVPLVVLANGKPGYVINQWVYWLLQEGITPSLLEQHLRAVLQLYHFYHRKYGGAELTQEKAERLLAEFLEAKRRGSELLGWPPSNNASTLRRYLSSINRFDEWQAAFHGGPSLNPFEARFLSAWERYRDFQQRTKWDPLLHLFPARAHMQRVHEHEVRIEHQRFRIGNRIIPKAFPLDRFVDLVERSPNPRDQMLWLLMGGGSLRASETLHLYYQDVIGLSREGATRIRLDDPEKGILTWSVDGKTVRGTRAEYLRVCFANERFQRTVPRLFGLAPRTFGKRGADHVGFKGMTFSTDPESKRARDGGIDYWHEMYWCDPRFGARFHMAYEAYVATYFHGKPPAWPHHPYLLISLEKKTFGYPLTLGAVRKAWHRALARIGMGGSGLGYHSLRHLYGAYCASVLKLPIETTRSLMHHASVTSTEVYYHLRSKDVQMAIAAAVAEHPKEPIVDYLIMPRSRLHVPSSWSP